MGYIFVETLSRHLASSEGTRTLIELQQVAAQIDILTPNGISDNIDDEIPQLDSTYQRIGVTLIPHNRLPGLTLLEYQTFDGAMAYQPCSKNIDLIGLFDSLSPIERGGDHLFKVARAWSCIVQAIEGLPKDLRWVLATIYNFSNEMLRPQADVDTLWRMRPWLMHWYEVADELCSRFDIFATSPRTDWFLRPTAVNEEESSHVESDAVWSQCHISLSSVSPSLSPSDMETIYHNPLRLSETTEDTDHGIEAPIPVSPAVFAWIDAQANTWPYSAVEFFDPTPGGLVSSRLSEHDQEVSEPEVLPPGRPDPEAKEFHPASELEPVNPYSSPSVASQDWIDCGFDVEELGRSRDNLSVSSGSTVELTPVSSLHTLSGR